MLPIEQMSRPSLPGWDPEFSARSHLFEPLQSVAARHIPHARQRLSGTSDKGRPSPLENMLSLFDEGGAVVLSSDPAVLQLTTPATSGRCGAARRQRPLARTI